MQRALLGISRGTTGFGPGGLDRVKVEVGDAVAMADAGLLERVLANLIDNALQLRAGQHRRVNAGPVSDRIPINVVDEGPGIPRGLEDQMFDAFQRLGRPQQQIRRGTRAVGRQRLLWEAMGGTIAATDTPGGGLTVVLRPGGAARSGRPMTKTKVLVIDDEPQILRALRINLSVRGYEVITAATGAAALKVAAEQHPDVIVLDLGLPDMDGIEVLGGLRGWLSAPVIVLSARTDSRREGRRTRCRRG